MDSIDKLARILRESKNAVLAIRQADTLIVGGTSLVVYPAAGLIDYFHAGPDGEYFPECQGCRQDG